ncbi:LPS export ABC transporter permease LptG [Oxalicibacterium faecigallinarum]|uniref:LPS export ABC transporter permease LptG n=2 Tax=Oxalicibacterium faecigallinarum TaxID=573741 RepID=A0A8J3ARZ5_9BURK|nr:LPS export ABC transporter permease LptG [Oxalicibacterium faecigallinarum]GGI15812.1 LPS export ABC transporter permease LptG [Oxalicibacterium faecigallinarum]
MRVLQKYFALEIGRSVLFVLIAFLALFAFFDLVGELKSVGQGGYTLQKALLYVALELPGYVYELMPIAALIGTIWALSQFAARSEFTIMRASSMSTGLAGLMLVKIGIVFVVITFAFGEFVVPHTSNLAQRTKMLGKGQSLSSEFRSGLWTKDVIRSDGMTGETIGSRFLNVGAAQANGQLQGLKIYEFNNNFHLVSLITAAKAEYQGANRWLLHDGSEAKFSDTSMDQPNKTSDLTDAIATERFSSRTLISEMTPEILSVGFTDPEQMSAIDLVSYTNYLSENNRETARYEIAFWKKVFYPFAVFVMMALALPFAYLHFRSGGVSLKIFTGIMIGVSFQLINSLFSHLGLLNTWPAFATAILPSALFMLAAVGALMWVERR